MKSSTLSRRGVFRKVLGAVACAFAGAGSVPRAKRQIDYAGPDCTPAESGVVRTFDEFGRVVQEVRFGDRAPRWTRRYYS